MILIMYIQVLKRHDTSGILPIRKTSSFEHILIIQDFATKPSPNITRLCWVSQSQAHTIQTVTRSTLSSLSGLLASISVHCPSGRGSMRYPPLNMEYFRPSKSHRQDPHELFHSKCLVLSMILPSWNPVSTTLSGP